VLRGRGWSLNRVLTRNFKLKFKTLGVPQLSSWLSGGSLIAVDIIAHRGASADAPENTLAAMQLAWEQGADAIELDLWLSKDGRPIVFHDADTHRFEAPAQNISSLTLIEAQRLDVGTWKGPRFRGERIPTLESILATIPLSRRAVLEIKCGPEIVPELHHVIHDSGRAPGQFVIISFNLEALTASKKAWPEIEHFSLHERRPLATMSAGPELPSLIARAKADGFDGLNLQFRWPITKDFVSEVKAAGLKLFVWTVDDPAMANHLAEAGVDGLTTNRPLWLREQLAARSPLP